MLCDRCKQNTATFHSSVNINGKITETHLCDECANDNKLFSFNNFLNPSFENIGLYGNLQEELTCDKCGYTLSDFKATGLLGCSNCYKVFRDVINKSLISIQPSMIHIGKRANSAPNLSETEQKIKMLESKLKNAVVQENYELASELKKEIIRLKEGGKNE